MTRIVLVPLDERPVNTGLPADVAAIAGVEIVQPPADLLPHFRTPGDTAGLAGWLEREAADARTSSIVVSIDTLVHGGLIPARISHDEALEVLARLDVLRRVRRARPSVAITAVSLITRASDSYSNVEEPEYWVRHGREIHALGGAVHQEWANGPTAAVSIPDEIRRDFAERRLRNHLVNLAVLDLHWTGVIDTLAITADDTAAFSAGSAEQEILRYWRILRPSNALEVYPGADETGAVLVARAIVDESGVTPTVRILADSAIGLTLIPPYENEPLIRSIERQVRATGASLVDGAADLVLVVHTPDPNRGDLFSSESPAHSPAAVTATVENVQTALDSGGQVALADVRYGNGADPNLVRALAEAGLLFELCAYSGWNTAGNALGSALALGVAHATATLLGTLDKDAARRALARRILDDYAWQAHHRARLSPALFDGRIEPIEAAHARDAEPVITVALQGTLRELDQRNSLEIERVSLPWDRSFEVDITFRAQS